MKHNGLISTTLPITRTIISCNPPTWGGGVQSMIEDAYRLLEEIGVNPYLLFWSNQNSIPISNEHQINFLHLQFPRVRQLNVMGMRSLVVPQLPIVSFDRYPHLHYLWFARVSKKLMNYFDLHIGVGAISLAALPLALAKKPFICWIATTYRDELEAKVNSLEGDVPAHNLLNSPSWKKLEELEKNVYQNAHAIIPLSFYTRERIKELYPQTEGTICPATPSPIDSSIFHPVGRTLLSQEDKKFEILCVTRVNDPRKNIQLLLEAFSIVLNYLDNDVKLLVVGEQPSNKVIDICKTLRIEGKVAFKNKLPRPQLGRLYRRASVFVLPSTQEGLGIVVLEAIACGLPVISTNCGGPEFILKASKAGEIVNADPLLLAQAIVNLLLDVNRWKTMSMNGVMYSQAYLQKDHVTRVFLNAIEKIS